MQRVGWDKAGVVGVSMVSPLLFSCSYPHFRTVILYLHAAMPFRPGLNTALCAPVDPMFLISSSNPFVHVHDRPYLPICAITIPTLVPRLTFYPTRANIYCRVVR